MSTDRAILRAAERLFYGRGYGSVGVDAIGAEAGVTGPAIYSHFKGKADILATLFDEAMDRMLEMAGPVREDPRDELDNLVAQHAIFVLEYRALLTVYTREDRALPEDALKRFHRRQRDYVDRWVAALEAVHPERERAALISASYAAIGMLTATTTWPREALQTDELPGLLADLARNALDSLSPNARSEPLTEAR